MEDYIKCELIGGGSPRHLIIIVYYKHIKSMLCVVAIVDCTNVVHYKIIRTYHILLQFLTAPM